MRIVGIIQARMGSTRLPGKMMMDLAGEPVIAWVVRRAQKSRRVDEWRLATTTDQSDDVLVKWAQANHLSAFRGSVDDVLDRFYRTAKAAAAENVVRVTGDCPLLDPLVVDDAVNAHIAAGAQYTSNTHPATYPDGLDVEVFSFAALTRAWQEAEKSSEREHVTPYIWKHPELFTIKNVVYKTDLSDRRWTLDTPEDYAFLRLVAEEIKRRGSRENLTETLAIVTEHPKWQAMNRHLERNEGYQRSVQSDL
ncbi:MAG: glycosyltransferase family protein [Candidatus Magasanikbacteria bacterium]|nr:glycosyltransferase family protein [Candidatus Magasanikbacteria bacterium]